MLHYSPAASKFAVFCVSVYKIQNFRIAVSYSQLKKLLALTFTFIFHMLTSALEHSNEQCANKCDVPEEPNFYN